ncbi:MAG: protein phosphatase 2C domain-containing protein [Synechococcaceae cyanobacterium]
MKRWADPRCETRLGASHRRRGQPCQDASGWMEASDRQGRPVRFLAVSDGHGAAQHPQSATGSRLACEIALRRAAHDLAQRDTAEEPETFWRQWLSRELPGAVVAGWNQAVAQHWSLSLGEPADTFSPILYGATLGLLVLTPRGWGYTGLGDWDLLELAPHTAGRFVSQEPWIAGDPEATHSLCLPGAERWFASRSGWCSLRDRAAPFCLVLSSDGLRKSCRSDADFFTLAQFLSELPLGQPRPAASGAIAAEGLAPNRGLSSPAADAALNGGGAPPPQDPVEDSLAAALDRISSQGSGDDISVAIAAWGKADADHAELPDTGAAADGCPRRGWIVQPPFSGRIGLGAPPAELGRHGVSPADGSDRSLGAGLVPPRRAEAASTPRRSATRPSRRWLLASLLGLGMGLVWLLPRPAPPPLGRSSGPHPRRAAPGTLTPPQERVLRRLVAELCHTGSLPRDAEASARLARRLKGAFSARKASFEQLRRQPASSLAQPLKALERDPLGALIAWSHDPASAEGLSPQRLRRLGACEALTASLSQRWRSTTPESAGADRVAAPKAAAPPLGAAPPSAPAGARPGRRP